MRGLETNFTLNFEYIARKVKFKKNGLKIQSDSVLGFDPDLRIIWDNPTKPDPPLHAWAWARDVPLSADNEIIPRCGIP